MDIRAASPLPVQLDRLLAFAVMALVWVMAFPRHLVAVGFVLVLLALGLEVGQEFRAGRHGREADLIVKLVGVALGLTMGGLLRWRTPSR